VSRKLQTDDANLSLEDALKEVCRQALVEGSPEVKLEGKSYAVDVIKSKRLRQVYFEFGGAQIVGVEQNPNTKSRWAELARSGKKVMQFMQDNRYLAVVADGKCILYGSKSSTAS
jgi:hypothetical protein